MVLRDHGFSASAPRPGVVANGASEPLHGPILLDASVLPLRGAERTVGLVVPTTGARLTDLRGVLPDAFDDVDRLGWGPVCSPDFDYLHWDLVSTPRAREAHRSPLQEGAASLAELHAATRFFRADTIFV